MTTTTDPILSYTVRRPGCTAWLADIPTEAAAIRAAAEAEQVTGLRHAIYAEHESGAIDGVDGRKRPRRKAVARFYATPG